MLKAISALCAGVGTKCSTPHWSEWRLVDPSQASISVDVADVSSGGAGAVIPVNVNVYGSYFLAGLENPAIGFCSSVRGFGGGAGASAGWQIPFVGAKVVGKMPSSIKKLLIEKIGGAAQSKAIEMLLDGAVGGVSGGTRIVCGPNASSGDLTVTDFNGFATIVTLGATFVVNGVSAGIVIFGSRPVNSAQDLIYAKAFALMGAAGPALSVDAGAASITYKTTVGA